MKFYLALKTLFWKRYLRSKGATVGDNFFVRGGFNILLRDGGTLKNLIIGNNVIIDGKTYIRMRKNGKIVLSDNVKIGNEVWLVTANDATLKVGKDTYIGAYGIINSGHGVEIGSDCLFAAFVNLNSSSHNHKKGELIRKQGYTGAPIRIGNDVWFGIRVVVTQGTTVGDGSIVGAGSVVTKDIGDNQIAVGVPAKVIRERT